MARSFAVLRELHLLQSLNKSLSHCLINPFLLPLSSSHSSTTRPSLYGILCLAIASRSLSMFPSKNLERQIRG